MRDTTQPERSIPPWVSKRLRWGEQVRQSTTFHWVSHDTSFALVPIVLAVLAFALAIEPDFAALAVLPGIPAAISLTKSVAILTARVLVTDVRLAVIGYFGADSYELGEVFGASLVQNRWGRLLGYARIDLYGLRAGDGPRDLRWTWIASVQHVRDATTVIEALVAAGAAKGFAICDPRQPQEAA